MSKMLFVALFAFTTIQSVGALTIGDRGGPRARAQARKEAARAAALNKDEPASSHPGQERRYFFGGHHRGGVRLLEKLAANMASVEGVGDFHRYAFTEKCEGQKSKAAKAELEKLIEEQRVMDLDPSELNVTNASSFKSWSLDPKQCAFPMYCCDWDEGNPVNGIFESMDANSYGAITETGDYRMVYLARDPISLVVSAYYHHRKLQDTKNVPGTGPDVLRPMSIERGLTHEANEEWVSTISNMHFMAKKAAKDRNVLQVNVEDFVKNFDRTVRKVYSFLLGAEHPQLESLCEKAKRFDLKRNPLTSDAQGHLKAKELVSPEGLRDRWNRANEIIGPSSRQVWKDLKASRAELGMSNMERLHSDPDFDWALVERFAN